MNYISSITKEEISALPVESFPGQIIVVDEKTTAQKAVEHLSTFSCIGFDTETRPNFTKNQRHKVSLIQLSSNTTCYLFRLNKLRGIPSSLINCLKNDRVIKVGLSLLDDFHAIRKLIDFAPVNFIDLQKFAPEFGIKDASLQKIYAILFGKKISKKNRLTNWEADELTEAQQHYAALDAWACLHIYQHLTQSR
ncbi:MAG: 3'-5' exonuclease domain-containing protein 2 [Tannerella sp.]|jgi:ribonuclease D|nr:3'-5' exonuclease domain-containing protein 2 [Tannerella sp.]